MLFGRPSILLRRIFIVIGLCCFLGGPLYFFHSKNYDLKEIKSSTGKIISTYLLKVFPSTVDTELDFAAYNDFIDSKTDNNAEENLKSVDSDALKGLNDKNLGLANSPSINSDKGSIIKQAMKSKNLNYLNEDGSLNTTFFKTFRYHTDQTKTKHSIENSNLFSHYMSEEVGEPHGKLRRSSEKYQLANATFICLARNSDLKDLIVPVNQVEDTFNKKFGYPWVFVNDDEFTDDFKLTMSQIIDSEVHFVKIPKKMWDKPSHIDPKLQAEGIRKMIENDISYADMESYHNMCRFYSGKFYDLEILQKFKYYWRVEPSAKFFCDIDYDVFKFMEENEKIYGFNINLYDSPQSIPTLWNETVKFLETHSHYLHPNGTFDWLLNDMQHPERNAEAGYSTCHFWSNFEIADMDFFRGEAYSEYFKYLDAKGGYYYERWGDAPVHSIGLGLFADKNKIHWFRDIGYEHFPFTHCPKSKKCKGCTPGKFSPWVLTDAENCLPEWIRFGLSGEETELF